LAEGDESVRRMIARVIESSEFEVVTATDGRQAIEFCRAQAPDVAVLDLDLPNPGVWEVVDALHAEDPELGLILLSSWPNQVAPAKKRGVDSVLEKPLDLNQLIQCIRTLSANRKSAHRKPREARSLIFPRRLRTA